MIGGGGEGAAAGVAGDWGLAALLPAFLRVAVPLTLSIRYGQDRPFSQYTHKYRTAAVQVTLVNK
jgi:hypothetical protein